MYEKYDPNKYYSPVKIPTRNLDGMPTYKKGYKCPVCGHEFRISEMAKISVKMGYPIYCPRCNHKGYIRKEDL